MSRDPSIAVSCSTHAARTKCRRSGRVPTEPATGVKADYWDFRSIEADADALTAGLSASQFNWKPAPNRWSVAECLDHLNSVGFLLLPSMDEAIRTGRARGITGNPPFRFGLIGRLFIYGNQPRTRLKVRTVKAYLPSSGTLDMEQTLNRFRTLQHELNARVEAADGLDLGKIKMTSPASDMLRMSLAAWFEGTLAHERRHLLQARRVTLNPAFPGPRQA